MTEAMRTPTLETLGLGSVLDLFRRGALPASAADLVDEVFGPGPERGALVVSGANGIVGAGKTMQLGSRLAPFGVTLAALDFPGVPDGIGRQYPGLVRAFGPERAARIMENVVRFSYDGKHLPARLRDLRPRFLLEAVPEILEIKKAHYAVFREAFPGIAIRSVTSGFPASELGVGIAHPAFPHEINKVWEVVEPEPSAVTKLFWALGLIPVPMGDHWSFVLDVLFCGLTLAGLRYRRATGMPCWKIDKYVRKLLGPNPFRAHDAIGAKGANFLTWSCLHHLAERYGPLFRPTEELVEHKDSGENWYPQDHFRPLVNWTFEEGDEEAFRTWILGPVIQMAGLMLHEERAHLSLLNAMGELCAQFRSGVLAVIRRLGAAESVRLVEAYHSLHPEAATAAWHPEVFEKMDAPAWRQLYVNAEHDGTVGVITLGRESYNHDVDAELDRALDWLKAGGIERVILTGDFHLTGQLVGADTTEFFPALENEAAGTAIAASWSRTARRLYDDFEVSVGLVNGKRCLGGMLELLLHCKYVVAAEEAELGMPEVTLPERRRSVVEDARVQVERAVRLHRETFGRPPTGMWPSEGSVSEGIIPLVAEAGIKWLASDEGVLARSLGRPLRREPTGSACADAELLYRAYRVASDGAEVQIVFRDHVLSDLIGFQYHHADPRESAQDFLERLLEIGRHAPGGECLVPVILDGENAWEHYPNQGVDFLQALYEGIVTTPGIEPVLLGEFLAEHPPTGHLPRLAAGSWINQNFAIWVGHEEDNRAWDCVFAARDFLRERTAGADPGGRERHSIAAAWEEIYIAEGSDWYWWYGEEHSSGQDEVFDLLFRTHLKNVYRFLGEEPPAELDVPVIGAARVTAYTPPRSFLEVKVEGRDSNYFEWLGAGHYSAASRYGAMHRSAARRVTDLCFGFNESTLFLKLSAHGRLGEVLGPRPTVEIIFSRPREMTLRLQWAGENRPRILAVDGTGTPTAPAGVAAALDYTHLATFAMAALAFAIMIILRRVNPRIPNVLVAVVVTIALSWALGFEKNEIVAIENIQKTESAIRDTDMASETTEFTKNQILTQAATAMLAQANAVPQGVLALLR